GFASSARLASAASTSANAVPQGWEAVIGVEVHAQLRSKNKLFSSAPLPTPLSPPNSLVCGFDAALPGSLPRLSASALDKALRACFALEADVQLRSTWDRKHYFYPDLTSGWQITQKYAPLAVNGIVRLRADEGQLGAGEEVDVLIEQVQLEQDTAKSQHYISASSGGNETHIDLNRAGSALVEIVSGPQLRSGEQAAAYVRKIQELLRRVGASDGNMDEGSLRCDVNVSVRRPDEPFGTRCEVKNLNSARFVALAIGHEVSRQIATLERGELVEQDTRGYDEATGTTFRLRSKADAPDYRYMPDPSLPPLVLTQETLDTARASLPELPDAQRARLLRTYPDLSLRDINVLMRIGLEDDIAASGSAVTVADSVAYFEQVACGRDPQVAMNWIIQDLLKALNQAVVSFSANPVAPEALAELIDLVAERQVTGTTARQLLAELVCGEQKLPTGATPVQQHLSSRGMLAMGGGSAGTEALDALLDEVVRDLPSAVAAVQAGKTKVLMRLVGEAMKRTQGRADAKAVKE
ncbi:Glutamyl-tRNA amidotransferase B subunit, partial [Tilletiopsis washingtonensis]